jgi:CubicO group peptidase (beta-lactamase class C family)
MTLIIHGEVSSGFEAVRDVFTAFWDDIEVGASVCAYYQGEKVVDLWGGHCAPDGTQNWATDTLVNVYSTTKGMGSLALAILADEGKIDYAEKVSTYWPEFGAAGKQSVTVAQLVSHQAGLCGVETKLTTSDLYDWQKMINLLAAQRPLWPLGTGAGYHAITWGYFPGELIRRITGQTLGEFFQSRVAGPLNADFFIGLPDQHHHRCATMVGPNRARKQPAPGTKPVMPTLFPIALQNPSVSPFKDASSASWRRAEIAGANGQANARGIASIYAALANGGELNGTRIISKKGLADALCEEVNEQIDLVLGKSMRRARGFMLNTGEEFGPNPSSFGHTGAGGSIGFADPAKHLAVGYAMNQMQADANATPRATLLINALYGCLGNVSP